MNLYTRRARQSPINTRALYACIYRYIVIYVYHENKKLLIVNKKRGKKWKNWLFNARELMKHAGRATFYPSVRDPVSISIHTYIYTKRVERDADWPMLVAPLKLGVIVPDLICVPDDTDHPPHMRQVRVFVSASFFFSYTCVRGSLFDEFFNLTSGIVRWMEILFLFFFIFHASIGVIYSVVVLREALY